MRSISISVRGRAGDLHRSPGDRHFGVAVRLQAGDEARAAQLRALRGGLAATYAARRNLLRVDAFRDEIVAHGIRAPLREAEVVLRCADAIGVADDRDAVVVRPGEPARDIVERRLALGMQRRFVEIEVDEDDVKNSAIVSLDLIGQDFGIDLP